MKLVVGLGNPGERYRLSRHNAGFLVIDEVSTRFNIPLKKMLFDSLTGGGSIEAIRVVLAKPQTYMNLSGASVGEIARYFDIPPGDMIVVHDDLDIPFNAIRLKKSGGHGGHKGLLSLAESLGTSDFPRVRIGIGRPQAGTRAEDYVLSPFTSAERESLPGLLKRAGEVIADLLTLGIGKSMARHHQGKRAIEPEGGMNGKTN